LSRSWTSSRWPGRALADRTRPGLVLGDKAYSSSAIRAHLRGRGIKATIPSPRTRNRLRRDSKGGRPPAFDPAAYKQRPGQVGLERAGPGRGQPPPDLGGLPVAARASSGRPTSDSRIPRLFSDVARWGSKAPRRAAASRR
jgi:hypothetical protein